MGEIFFYLQETSLLEKLYFSLVPVPNCSRTNARNSLIYLYSVLLSGAYCTWHLLWHITVLQIIPGTFTFWKYCGGKVSKSPLLTCCHQPAGTVPGPFHLASKGPKPCSFLNAAAATAWVYFGGAKCSFCWKKSSNTVNFCQFCQMNSFRIEKPKLLEMDFAMKCLFVQRFPFALFFFLMWKMLKNELKCFLWDWVKLFY